MGMFDYVRCEYPLPDGFQPRSGLFQTKDLASELVTHVITREGRLLEEQIDETSVVPKDERPYPNAPEDSILSVCGMLRSTKSQHDRSFHGILRFYSRDEDAGWHEYEAKFTDGQLVVITVVTSEAA